MGRVSALRWTMNSTCGRAAHAAHRFATHASAPASLANAPTSLPFALVAFTCMR